MFHPVIVICAATIATADCNTENAKEIVTVGRPSPTKDACAVQLRVELMHPGDELKAATERGDTISVVCLED